VRAVMRCALWTALPLPPRSPAAGPEDSISLPPNTSGTLPYQEDNQPLWERMFVGVNGGEVRVPKMAELVAEQLRRRIVRGEFTEGEPLPTETSLLESLGVSRPTLREALRVLENEGLVRVYRGARGSARVRLPNDEVVARYAGLVLEHRRTRILDVSETRVLLEIHSIKQLAASGDPVHFAALRTAMEDAEGMDDPMQQLAAQHAFHALLVRLAGNQTIVLLHGSVQQIIDRATNRRWAMNQIEAANVRRSGAAAHRLLVNLIERGATEQAGRVWRHHIEETAEQLFGDDPKQEVIDVGLPTQRA
jgi:DNA-binding FadR family transcriptional regulator